MKSIYSFIRGLSVILMFSLSGVAVASEKPNILVIFTDDQRADTINVLGNPHIHTPNLDLLAKRSRVFSNGYCYGAHTGAVCIASRNQLMTANVWHRWSPDRHCSAKGETLPKAMKAAGYETFYMEKSGEANHPDIWKQFDHYKDIHNVTALKSGRACRPFVDDAISFLKGGRDREKPFFMYLGVSGPHDPRYAEKRFRDQYELKNVPLPKNFKPLHHWNIGSMTIRDECLEKWPRDPEATRTHILDYYALVTAMDHDLGRLLAYLKEGGLEENTIIVFSSDHGLSLGSQGLFGKQNVYEDAMKVPFMVAGPGIEPGATDAFAYIHDIFPTVLDYAGGILKEEHDGVSLRSVIEGKKEVSRQVLSLAYQNSQRSIRDDEWKLMVFPKINKHQLFNLKKDPYEMRDLASQYPNQVERLKGLLIEQQKMLGDVQSLTVERPAPAEFRIPKKPAASRARAGGEAKLQTTD